jgi:hypothetical protein
LVGSDSGEVGFTLGSVGDVGQGFIAGFFVLNAPDAVLVVRQGADLFKSDWRDAVSAGAVVAPNESGAIGPENNRDLLADAFDAAFFGAGDAFETVATDGGFGNVADGSGDLFERGFFLE